MKLFLAKLWEAPQHLVAKFVIKFFKAEQFDNYKDAYLFHWTRNDGLSLGRYIFLPFNEVTEHQWRQNFVKHEYGHSIQSQWLGWLYLLVIALPSIIWAGCFDNFRKKTNTSYYWFYTEALADKLGGVNRKEG